MSKSEKTITRRVVAECQRLQTLAVEENRKLHAELGCANWQTNKRHAKIRAANIERISDHMRPFSFSAVDVRNKIEADAGIEHPAPKPVVIVANLPRFQNIGLHSMTRLCVISNHDWKVANEA